MEEGSYTGAVMAAAPAPISLNASVVPYFALSCQAGDGVCNTELRCGFFDVDLELLEQSAGVPWVAVAESGQRLEVRSTTDNKVSTQRGEAIIALHLHELPATTEFLVLAAVSRPGCGNGPDGALLQPLVLSVKCKEGVIHQVARRRASGGPGTLLAVLARSAQAWQLHEVSPNASAALLCGERENVIIRELYWPEVGVAIQRSSPGVSGGHSSVSWLEVFQAPAAEGSLGSSDDDDDGGSVTTGGSLDSLPLPQHPDEPKSVIQDLRAAPVVRAVVTSSSSESISVGESSDAEAGMQNLHGFQGGPVAELAFAADTAPASQGKMSPEFLWPKGGAALRPPGSHVPHFGMSPTPTLQSSSAENSASTFKGGVASAEETSPALLLGSPLTGDGCTNLSDELASGTPHQSADLTVDLAALDNTPSPAPRTAPPPPPSLTGGVVEQPIALPAAGHPRMRRHKGSATCPDAIDANPGEVSRASEEINTATVLRNKCDAQAEEIRRLVARNRELEGALCREAEQRQHGEEAKAQWLQGAEARQEEARRARQQLLQENAELRRINQAAVSEHSSLLTLAKRHEIKLEELNVQTAQDAQALQMAEGFAQKLTAREEEAQRSAESLWRETAALHHEARAYASELQSAEAKACELQTEGQANLVACRSDAGELKAKLENQGSELSQSQKLVADLRHELKGVTEERDQATSEAASLGSQMRSSQTNGLYGGSLLALQQRMQEATLEADRERHRSTEARRACDQLRLEQTALQETCEAYACELQEAVKTQNVAKEEASERTASLRRESGILRKSLCDQESQHAQSQALAAKLQQEALGLSQASDGLMGEVLAERARGRRLEDELREEQSAVQRIAAASATVVQSPHEAAGSCAAWQTELGTLRAELRETEREFNQELATVRSRLSGADQRNRKLCESLRSAMQVAGNAGGASNGTAVAATALPAFASAATGPGTAVAMAATGASAPASPLLPPPSFALEGFCDARPRPQQFDWPSFDGKSAGNGDRGMHNSAVNNALQAGVSEYGERHDRVEHFASSCPSVAGSEEGAAGRPCGLSAGIAGRPSAVPRASGKQPRSLQGDYLRFVDFNHRSSVELGSWQKVQGSSRCSSPRAPAPLLRQSHSQTSLSGRSGSVSAAADNELLLNAFGRLDVSSPPSRSQTRHGSLSAPSDNEHLLLNDVSDGAPELGLGPGGPGRPMPAMAAAAGTGPRGGHRAPAREFPAWGW